MFHNMSFTLSPRLPPLYALPMWACAALEAERVPVGVDPESCAAAKIGDSLAICMSFAVPKVGHPTEDPQDALSQAECTVPVSPDPGAAVVSHVPGVASKSQTRAYIPPSKHKKKRLKREFHRLASIDDTLFISDDVRELEPSELSNCEKPVTYVSTAFLYLENVSGVPSDTSGDELDVGHDDCDSEEDEELLPSDPRSSQYLDYLYLKGTEIASTEPVSACDSADECDQSQWLPPSDPRSSQYLDYLYHKEAEILNLI